VSCKLAWAAEGEGGQEGGKEEGRKSVQEKQMLKKKKNFLG
jgi:hypothetical protein